VGPGGPAGSDARYQTKVMLNIGVGDLPEREIARGSV
jgi:hypothetical protein